MRTLWRATKVRGPVGRLTWWAEDRACAEAYRHNQGYGGPVLFRLETAAAHVLDLTADEPDYSRGDDDMIAMLADALQDGDLAEAHRGDYVHDVLEDPSITDRLAREYDWVIIYDSYPEGARTWLRLDLVAGEQAHRA